ncbi:MAG: chemotaxis protein CheB, partial [Armatimonadota bacterium]|nr:chemotaxis protein CheB [Armatimonadota bacterium]
MSGHDIIVIGASAGGVEALAQVAQDLPADLAAAVFIVLHVPAHGVSVLPAILSRRGPLPATHPVDGEPIRSGHIYIAPPDHQLLVKHGHVRVVRGPNENGHRPSVDPLFRSAARFYGPRVIGVILSGTLDDGTSGLMSVKRRGGLAVVQDPEEALFSGMPRSAVENVSVDWVVPLAEVGATLTHLAREPIPEAWEAASAELEGEVDVAEMEMGAIEAPRPGAPSGFTCPDCHGALWEVQEGDLIRFRCRVGHAYSPDSLVAAQSEALEEALWIAMRSLEENAALSDRLAERAQGRGHGLAAERFGEQAQDARHRASIIRQALTQGQL